MPGKDLIEDIANLPRIEAQFASIQAGYKGLDRTLAEVKKSIQGLDTNIDFAKNAGLKDFPKLATDYNKSVQDMKVNTETLLKVQILQEKQAEATARRLLAEEKLRQANAKALDNETKAIQKQNTEAEKKSKITNGPIVDQIVNSKDDVATEGQRIEAERELAQIEQERVRNAAELKALQGDPTLNSTNAKQEVKAIQEVSDEYELQLTPLEQSIETRNKLIQTNKNLKADQIEDKALLKAGTIDRLEYNKRIIESSAAIEVNKQKIKESNIEVRAQTLIQNNAAGSLKNNQGQLELLTLKYSKLSKEVQASPVGIQMQQQAKAFATAIDQQQSSLGNYTKNVGNYFSKAYSGLRILANILPGVGIAGIIGAIGTALLFVVEKLEIFETTAGKTTKQINALKNTTNETKEALKDMGSDAIEIASKTFEELIKNVDKLNEELGLTPTAIDKVNASTQLLIEQAINPSTWQTIVSLFKAGGNGAVALSDRVAEATKEIKKLDKALEEQKLKENLKVIAELDKEKDKDLLQSFKDQQELNRLEINDAGTTYQKRTRLNSEFFELQKKIRTNQYFDDLNAAKGNEAKIYALKRQYLSDNALDYAKYSDEKKKIDLAYFEENRKAQLATDERALSDAIARNQKEADNANDLPERKINALQRLAKAQSDLYDKQEADEIRLVEITDNNEAKKKDIYDKYDNLRTNAAETVGKKIVTIALNDINAVEKAYDKAYRNIENNTNFGALKKQIDSIKTSGATNGFDTQDEFGNIERNLNPDNSVTINNNTQSAFAKIIENDVKTISESETKLQDLSKGYEGIVSGFLKFKGNLADQKEVDEYVDSIKKITEALKQLGSELIGAAFDIFTNKLVDQQNKLQDQIDLIDKKKQADIDLATQTITDEEKKAAAIQAINIKADADKAVLEKKQRDLEVRKAQFEKAQSIASIILNTAQAVTAALTSKPPNLILASIVGAIGLIQAARAAAAPIPRYKGGGVHKSGGIAEVGDGGKREGLLYPDGSMGITDNKSTFVDLPAGTHIFSDFNDMVKVMASKGTMQVNERGKLIDLRPAINKMERNVVKAVLSKQTTHIYGMPRHKVLTQQGSSFRTYLNNHL